MAAPGHEAAWSLESLVLLPAKTRCAVVLVFKDSCITQLKAQGPSKTCEESKEEEEEVGLGGTWWRGIEKSLVNLVETLSGAEPGGFRGRC